MGTLARGQSHTAHFICLFSTAIMECAICIEPLSANRITLSCTHAFCASCLFHAALQGHNSCPTCRSPMDAAHDSEGGGEVDYEEWDEEDLREAEERQVRLLLRRAKRMVGKGTASAPLTAAVEHYRRAVAALDTCARDEKAARTLVIAHKKALQRAVDKLRREQTPLVQSLVRACVWHTPHTEQYYDLEHQVTMARRSVADEYFEGLGE